MRLSLKFLKNKNNIKMAREILSDNKSIEVFDARTQLSFKYHKSRKEVVEIMSKVMETSCAKTDSVITFEDGTRYTLFVDDKQYFLKEIILLKNECFLDCGAYIGDTIQTFLQESNYEFDSIFSFEPNIANYNLCIDSLLQYEPNIREKIKVFNYGLGLKESVLYFPKTPNPGCGGLSEKITPPFFCHIMVNSADIPINSFEKCDIKNINDVLTQEELTKISFVKMDIEGNELDVLKSLEDIIKQNKPNLAICVYHKAHDFFEIPLYIKSLVPEYKIYLRHHSNSEWETVCYAVL
jgi:FkbM family methyltransferase